MAIALRPRPSGAPLAALGLALALGAALTAFGALAVWLVQEVLGPGGGLHLPSIGVAAGAAAVAGVVADRLDRARPTTAALDLRGAAVTAAISSVLLAGGVAIVAAVAAPTIPVTRIAGDGRIETASMLSSRTFERAHTVVLAGAEDPFGALAAAPLAASVNGPLLLTGAGGLADDAARELERLGATTVHLVGGDDALSAAVADDLVAARIDVVRSAGDDRYATAAKAAAKITTDHVYVTSGTRWAESLSAAAVAARTGGALLLTSAEELPEVTASAIERLRPRRVTIVGDDGVVAPAVADRLRALVPDAEVVRLADADRYTTARRTLDDDHHADRHVVLATGEDWPDALVGAPVAAELRGQLVLVSPEDDAATNRWLLEDRRNIERAHVVGGDGAVADALVEALRED